VNDSKVNFPYFPFIRSFFILAGYENSDLIEGVNNPEIIIPLICSGG